MQITPERLKFLHTEIKNGKLNNGIIPMSHRIPLNLKTTIGFLSTFLDIPIQDVFNMLLQNGLNQFLKDQDKVI